MSTRNFDNFLSKLTNGERFVLSGAMGTEIQRRGVHTGLPLWSASALITNPEIVKNIHRDYIDAGAEMLSTNTFRTNVRAFERAGKTMEDARQMTLRACALAIEARDESTKSTVVIGGSVAPVEDCYEPTLVPKEEELEREHSLLVGWLAESNVDFIFIETMNTIREALIAAKAATNVKLPFMVSFVCNRDGNLLSGETIEEAVRVITPLGPAAFLTNCRPLTDIEASVDKLLACSPVPAGVYANGDGKPNDETGWEFEGQNPEANYVEHARRWIDAGVKIVGSCCGSTPAYTRRIAELIHSRGARQ